MPRLLSPALLLSVGAAALGAAALSAAPLPNGSEPVAEPVLETPTLQSLGVHWTVRGDANRNASVALDYRVRGEGDWRTGAPLFRVERGRSRTPVPEDAWLFAGSAVLLQPGTAYELRLRLSDPDGGSAERTLQTRTREEPTAPGNLRTSHVVPGDGGGTGSKEDPFRGLAAAQRDAAPGSLYLLHAGTYPGVFTARKSGEPGRPIIWRAAGDGPVVLDGRGSGPTVPGRVVDASGSRDVWLEGLTIQNGLYGLVANEATRLVVRRCRFTGVSNGITATRNPARTLADFYIADNVLEGPMAWPPPPCKAGASAEELRGIQITGTGHVVCRNRVHHFKDAIDTFQSPECAAIDIYRNDVSECVDDAIELDFSDRNVRCWENRATNMFQGISAQPIHGGPVYAFRNVLYNVEVEPFKLHNSPSGFIAYHNTVVKTGMPLLLWTSAPASNCVFRNNLFVGTPSRAAFDCDAPMNDCDFDYDGFAGGPWSAFFLKWNRARYATAEETRAKAPVYRHVVDLDAKSLFASGLQPPAAPRTQYSPADARPKAGVGAIDAGQTLPGFDDGFRGMAPDLGAYELGSALPQYGPRP